MLLTRSSRGDRLHVGRGLLLNHHAVKRGCTQQTAMRGNQVAYLRARMDRRPGVPVVSGFKDVGGSSACGKNAVARLVELNGKNVGLVQQANSLPGFTRIRAAKQSFTRGYPDVAGRVCQNRIDE